MNTQPFKRAFVSGATSGIGEELCNILVKEGISLMISGRNQEKLDALAKEWGKVVDVLPIQADLSQREERTRVIELLYQHTPDLIVNNAGIGLYGEALAHKTEAQMEMLEINSNAVLEMTLEGARALISKGKEGVIVNISSAAAFQTFPCFAVYAASKAFVNDVSQSLDEELRSHGVRVLSSCPGMVLTQFQERSSKQKQERHSPNTMSVDFAAQEIWKQIGKRKGVHVFDWRFRLGTWLSRYILPKWLVNSVLRKMIQKRHMHKDLLT